MAKSKLLDLLLVLDILHRLAEPQTPALEAQTVVPSVLRPVATSALARRVRLAVTLDRFLATNILATSLRVTSLHLVLLQEQAEPLPTRLPLQTTLAASAQALTATHSRAAALAATATQATSLLSHTLAEPTPFHSALSLR